MLRSRLYQRYFSFSPLTRADIWSNSFENPIYKGIVTSETSCLQRGTNTRDLSRSLNSASVVGLPLQLDYRYYIPLPLVNSQLPIKRVTKKRGSMALLDQQLLRSLYIRILGGRKSLNNIELSVPYRGRNFFLPLFHSREMEIER